MIESISNNSGGKKVHKQGPNWYVVGRYEDFESANARRHKEINEGRTAKVHKLSSAFVVKVKPSKLETTSEEVTVETKQERPRGKQQRQDRSNKR